MASSSYKGPAGLIHQRHRPPFFCAKKIKGEDISSFLGGEGKKGAPALAGEGSTDEKRGEKNVYVLERGNTIPMPFHQKVERSEGSRGKKREDSCIWEGDRPAKKKGESKSSPQGRKRGVFPLGRGRAGNSVDGRGATKKIPASVKGKVFDLARREYKQKKF